MKALAKKIVATVNPFAGMDPRRAADLLLGLFGPDAARRFVVDMADGVLPQPGEFPFTSGPHRSMYDTRPGKRGRLWTMRMFSGMGDARQTNERWKHLIAHGEGGLSTAYDDCTLAGRDPIDKVARGTIGKSGVHISCLADYEELYDGIDIGGISSSQTINGPGPLHMAAIVALADKRGVDRKNLRGTTQIDILKEYLAQNEVIFSPEHSMRFIADLAEFCIKEVPQWYWISLSSYHIGEKGATQVEEVALTLANAFTYVEELSNILGPRGIAIDQIARRLSFFFTAKANVLEVIATYRAARRIWATEMRERYHAEAEPSWQLRVHTQTSGRTLTTRRVLNNIVRTALQALSAVLAGTQSLHTNSYDEEVGLPSEEAVTVALDTQKILAFETGLTEHPDPFRGSIVMERMTDRIEEQMRGIIQSIRERGGMMQEAARTHALDMIEQSSMRQEHDAQHGRRVVVGVTDSTDAHADEIDVEEVPIDESVERGVRERFIAWKEARDGNAERSRQTLVALDAVRAAARTSDQNVMYPIVAALKADASFGEIIRALIDVWGRHPHRVYISPARSGGFKVSEATRARFDAIRTALGRPPKVLVSKIAIDFHDAGAIYVVQMLRDLGCEVIPPGFYEVTPEEIAAQAIDEGVDVIGLSNSANSYLAPTLELQEILRAGGQVIPIIVGGIIRKDTFGTLEAHDITWVRPRHPDDFVVNQILDRVVKAHPVLLVGPQFANPLSADVSAPA